MASIKAVSAAIKPDLIVHGGDMTNGSESKDTTIAFTDSVANQLKEVGGNNTLILIGNHDGNGRHSRGSKYRADGSPFIG